MKLLIIDDHPIFRQALTVLLRAIRPDVAVEEAGDLPEALERAAAEAFDIVLLDLKLPGTTGVAALHTLRERLPDMPVIVVSGETYPPLVREAIEAGAMGFLPKSLPPDALAQALRDVLDGRVFLPEDAALNFAGPPPDDRLPELTARQMDVLRLVVQGKSNKAIARELGLSAQTVKSHVTGAMRALGAHNRTELVYVAARRGLRLG